MKVNYKTKAILWASTILGVFASSAPVTVLAAGAGGDSNASGTVPATNPTINWAGGGANGSVDVNDSIPSGSSVSGQSLAGISWHTTAEYSKLTLMRVPNFDFGSWAFTGGATGSGATNSTWYPTSGTGLTSGPAYDNSGVGGNPNYAPLAAEGTALVSASPDRYVVTNSNRVLEVNDTRNGTAGWKVQLTVGDFKRTTGSPTGSVDKLNGAAIAIMPTNISYKKDSTDNLVGTVPPEWAGSSDTTPIVVYAGDLTAPTTLFSADQQDLGTFPITNKPEVGQGKWIMDFTKANSALFTSPTEGLGTYTSTLTWTLTSGPS